MIRKIKLGVIFGGRSGEHEVSLMSARSVLSVINLEKFDLIEIGITRQGNWLIGEHLLSKFEQNDYSGLTSAYILPSPYQPGIYVCSPNGLTLESALDVVFPVMHGSFSEDGSIQGLLELADLAYVGAGVLGSAICMDKGLFKDLMSAFQIPVLPFKVLTSYQIQKDLDRCVDLAEEISSYPLFTKPANLGSSVGISKCKDRKELREGLTKAACYDRRVLVEKGLDNPREIEVSILGNEEPITSTPGEILPKDAFYTYAEKYINDTAELIIPANLTEEVASQVQKLSIKAYQVSDCGGMGRVDFLIDRITGELFLSEINTIPGFTSISMYPKLWEASGIPYSELIEKLIDLALQRKQLRDQLEREYRG